MGRALRGLILLMLPCLIVPQWLAAVHQRGMQQSAAAAAEGAAAPFLPPAGGGSRGCCAGKPTHGGVGCLCWWLTHTGPPHAPRPAAWLSSQPHLTVAWPPTTPPPAPPHLTATHPTAAAAAATACRDRRWGRTALHWAARGGHYECVAILTAAGAELGAVDRRGWTPAALAGHYNRKTICQALAAAHGEQQHHHHQQQGSDWAGVGVGAGRGSLPA